MSSIKKILICDDNDTVHETIGTYLKNDEMTYISAYDGKEALEKFNAEKPDLVILDLMMPKIFGTEVCKEIRKISNVPIIMLTAKGEEIDRIVGLEIGADDYIVKPFSPREVVTRIKTIFRRVGNANIDTNLNRKLVTFNNFNIDLDKYEIRLNKEKIDVTPKECQILYLLATNEGRVLSREEILDKVWGYDYFGDTRVVDTQIKRIRKKIPEEGEKWSIKTVYGIGYKFEVLK
ncbi:response regulator transcription factor [Clostridium botulinum]|uniref:response regulator transcription factor n=1 Tax=Clostridium botulinum TaxID=1491 RepID=UPI000773CFF3|nr:response regulator transcription factor [Clostridium botulinum]MBY6811091.1 response regulator transcription factor [Clostridium botulinum]MBY6824559.1 response regulator transcription factor [Clostridium botulinum]MBY6834947.1 response regulator transcription factor [Clostridium botulinum]MBY6838200.1 response regulator transcription factor [Clostridium botulinum]MBY6931202.1 response regulator transcription factor [Clostridium botulinum]